MSSSGRHAARNITAARTTAKAASRYRLRSKKTINLSRFMPLSPTTDCIGFHTAIYAGDGGIMRLTLINSWLLGLFYELFDSPVKFVDSGFVVGFQGIHNAVFEVVFQDDFAGIIDCAADS